MTSTSPIIAIDGPGASGKGVVSHHLARKYGYHLLDSGALYRLVGLQARQADVPLDAQPLDAARLAELASELHVAFTPTGDPENPLVVTLAGRDVTQALRSDQAGTDASLVASLPAVRRALYGLQQSLRQPPGLVADGRDMGTVVFPDAIAKIYITASAEARAQRRLKQLQSKAEPASLRSLQQSIEARDERDRTRKASPLRVAEDALVVDSTHLGMAEVLARIEAFVAQRLG